MRPRARPATDPAAWCTPGAHALHRRRSERYGMPCVVVQRGGGELVTVRLSNGATTIVSGTDLYPNPLQLAPREPAA